MKSVPRETALYPTWRNWTPQAIDARRPRRFRRSWHRCRRRRRLGPGRPSRHQVLFFGLPGQRCRTCRCRWAAANDGSLDAEHIQGWAPDSSRSSERGAGSALVGERRVPQDLDIHKSQESESSPAISALSRDMVSPPQPSARQPIERCRHSLSPTYRAAGRAGRARVNSAHLRGTSTGLASQRREQFV
jgi:hypothetical protein